VIFWLEAMLGNYTSMGPSIDAGIQSPVLASIPSLREPRHQSTGGKTTWIRLRYFTAARSDASCARAGLAMCSATRKSREPRRVGRVCIVRPLTRSPGGRVTLRLIIARGGRRCSADGRRSWRKREKLQPRDVDVSASLHEPCIEDGWVVHCRTRWAGVGSATALGVRRCLAFIAGARCHGQGGIAGKSRVRCR
jgi:hypothetical protein